MNLSRVLIAASVSACWAFSAHALTIDVVEYSEASYNSIYGSGSGILEGFETHGATYGQGEVANGFSTSVGTFSTLGGIGSGGTVSGLPGNSGSMLALREGNVFGRENLSPNGSWFLDSNDTWGLSWDVALAGGKAFDKLTFALSDGSDAGGFLRITAGGESHELRTDRRLSDGNVRLVTINFGAPTKTAGISLANYTALGGDVARRNDGFSIDAIQVAAVPLPPSILLLGGALFSLGFVTHRRRKAAA
ncbi:hypothetical protein [Ruegeria meonggei]|uniref:PEP-CTERM protein-sorting domain-containing protein n=1 Tax=Ruegeria meonggei TaxID=1446476 RepID=A0A1X6ZVJ3_9RHOB|nr:hypothetical protein [Ruegeria meonggei]SLN62101.1 hypothetical protein RUM8411_03044 [Ruegeria meonggei]